MRAYGPDYITDLAGYDNSIGVEQFIQLSIGVAARRKTCMESKNDQNHLFPIQMSSLLLLFLNHSMLF